MDPNKTLEEIREIYRRILDDPQSFYEGEFQDYTDRLAWLIESLDNWITNVGFLPTNWQNKRINEFNDSFF